MAVYEATAETKYLDAARAVAETLVRRQREDGSWPFRVVPEDGTVRQDFGGAPVFLVEFFERMLRYEDKPAYRRAHDQALKYMLQTNVEKNRGAPTTRTSGSRSAGLPVGGTHVLSPPITSSVMQRRIPSTSRWDAGILRRMEERLVHTDGHAAAPAPAVAEQAGFNHIMPGHTARYCLALADLYALTRDEQVKRRALSGINALTYMQAPSGLFRTFFHSVNPKAAKSEAAGLVFATSLHGLPCARGDAVPARAGSQRTGSSPGAAACMFGKSATPRAR